MSQSEVFEFLKRNSPRRFKPLEIQINLGLAQNTCHQNLKRLVKYKDIQYKDHLYWVEVEDNSIDSC